MMGSNPYFRSELSNYGRETPLGQILNKSKSGNMNLSHSQTCMYYVFHIHYFMLGCLKTLLDLKIMNILY